MDDFSGLLARDFGLKPQGKSAPMAPSRDTVAGSFKSSSASSSGFRSSSSTNKYSSMPIFDDHDRSSGDDLLFNDVFGGPPKYASADSRSKSAFDYDTVSKDHNVSNSASAPVYDKPVYDEDIFEGIPGLKSSSPSGSAKYDDVFASISSSPPRPKKPEDSAFDDLLGNFGKKETKSRGMEKPKEEKKTTFAFDDLIPGFGGSSFSSIDRSASDSNQPHKSSSDATKTASNLREDPFVLFESSSAPKVSSADVFTDPLDEIGKLSSSGSRNAEQSSAFGGVFDDLDNLDRFGKSQPESDNRWEDTNQMSSESMNSTQSPIGSSRSMNKVHVDDFLDSHNTSFETSSASVPRTTSPTHVNSPFSDVSGKVDRKSTTEGNLDPSDEIWITVSEIPLFTQPTSAPPPSRPPPPKPTKPVKKKVNDFSSLSDSSKHSHSPQSGRAYTGSSIASQIDELEDFAMGKARSSANGYPGAFSGEETNADHVAAAMKEAMDKAEAKFRHAREVRERENLKAGRAREGVQHEKDSYLEKERRERQERLDREQKQTEKEEEENERRRLEKERERAREFEREMEEKEKERKRLERERLEREREVARQAVERATREARERAAAEARAKAQKAAVEKAAAEARERAERAAVQRAQAEARERAAVEARERAAKAAAEAREKEAREKEARLRAERAAAERAAAERAAREARERAAAEARERAAEARESAAAQARAKNDDDLESFFSMGTRANSAPKSRANFSEPLFDTQKKPPEAARSSSGASSIRKASSTTNIVDDLSFIFGAAASPSGEFQEVEGESEERRRARLERHQRTQERAAKALAEKNERDLQAQREQAERYRIAETLDVEIRRWAAGKEGNLRALLSTLQYVLWPECGWQPVSLTDLITAASVKKVYRKATLCIHPDKVQQKGATLQQKYIAEKVFDLLKEAWNKFNSEELF